MATVTIGNALSKSERKKRMKAAVQQQMEEHPEWYDGTYNNGTSGRKQEFARAVSGYQQATGDVNEQLKKIAQERAQRQQTQDRLAANRQQRMQNRLTNIVNALAEDKADRTAVGIKNAMEQQNRQKSEQRRAVYTDLAEKDNNANDYVRKIPNSYAQQVANMTDAELGNEMGNLQSAIASVGNGDVKLSQRGVDLLQDKLDMVNKAYKARQQNKGYTAANKPTAPAFDLYQENHTDKLAKDVENKQRKQDKYTDFITNTSPEEIQQRLDALEEYHNSFNSSDNTLTPEAMAAEDNEYHRLLVYLRGAKTDSEQYRIAENYKNMRNSDPTFADTVKKGKEIGSEKLDKDMEKASSTNGMLNGMPLMMNGKPLEWKGEDLTTITDEEKEDFLRRYGGNATTNVNALSTDSGYGNSLSLPASFYMTNEEAENYYYLIGKEGQDAADDYMDSIMPTLNQRKAGANYNAYEELLKAKGYSKPAQFAVKTGAVGQNLVLGAKQFGENVQQVFSKELLPTSANAYANQLNQELLGEYSSVMLPEFLRTDDKTIWQGAGETATNIGQNAVPALIGRAVGGVLGEIGVPALIAGKIVEGVTNTAFGLSVYGGAKAESLAEGNHTYGETVTYALLNTASELGIEKLLGGMEYLGESVTGAQLKNYTKNISSAWKRAFINMNIDAMGEFTEESIQEIIGDSIKYMAYGHGTEQYKVSAEELMEKFGDPETLYSGVMGYLTAVLMGGATSALNEVQESRQIRAVTDQLKVNYRLDNEYTRQFVQEVYNQANANSQTEMMEDALAILKGAVPINDRTIGNLVQEYAAAGGDISLFTGEETDEQRTQYAKERAAADLWQSTVDQAVQENEEILRRLTAKEATGKKLNNKEKRQLAKAQAFVDNIGEQKRKIFTQDLVPTRDGAHTQVYARNLVNRATENGRRVGPAVLNEELREAQRADALTSGARIAQRIAQDEAERTAAVTAPADAQREAQNPAQTREYGSNSRFSSAAPAAAVLESADTEATPSISIAAVDSVKDNTVYLRTTDGEIVDAADVTFDDDTTQRLVDTAITMKMDEDETLAFINNYTGDSTVSTYAAAYIRAYGMARKGASLNDVLSAEAGYGVSAEAITAAYNAATKNGTLQQSESTTEQKTGEQKQTGTGEQKQQKPGKRKGGLHREYDSRNLSEESKKALRDNRTQLEAIDSMAKQYGIDVRLVETLDGIHGMVGDGNGLYVSGTNTIYISVNAQDGAYGYVAMHEITHMIEEQSKQNYDTLQSLIFRALEQKGYSLNAMIAHQEKLGYNREDAEREVVCNNASVLFSDTDFLRSLGCVQPGVLRKIRDFFRELHDSLSKALASMRTHANYVAADALLSDVKLIDKMEAAMTAAMDDIRKDMDMQHSNTEGEEIKLSRKYDTAYMDNAQKVNDVTHYVAQELMDKVRKQREEIAQDMERRKDVLALPEDKEDNTEVGDSAYGVSMENSTVCIRSLIAGEFVDAVAEELKRPLTQEEAIFVSQEAAAYMRNPECVYCYVAMDRASYREFLGNYLKQRDSVTGKLEAQRKNGTLREAFEEYKKNEQTNFEARNAMEKVGERKRHDNKQSGLERVYLEYLTAKRKDTMEMRNRFRAWVDNMVEARELMTAEDLSSEEKMIQAMGRSDEIRKQIEDAQAYASAASWGKKKIPYHAYNNSILNWSRNDKVNKNGKLTLSKVSNLNKMYGVRFYSFSDYSPAFLLENMQMVTDASVQGLKGLAYTKDLDFAKIFAPTGMNINISVFGYVHAGQTEVTEDDMYGANWEEAKALREKYTYTKEDGTKTGNVGITFVATDDACLKWALKQDWIDVVIPFHLVRTGKSIADLLGFRDYKRVSSDKKIKGKWQEGNEKEIYPSEHQNDKDTYLAACERNGLKPRFAAYVNDPGYMKLVNETRQSEHDTKAMQPIFDMEAARASLDKLEKEGGYIQHVGGKDIDTMRELAEDTAKKINNGGVQEYRQKQEKITRESKIRKSMYDLLDEDIMGQAKDYRERLTNITKAFKINDGVSINDRVVLRATREAIKGIGEKGEVLAGSIAYPLMRQYRAFKAGDITEEQMYNSAYEIVRSEISNTTMDVDPEFAEDPYPELRARLKGATIYMSEDDVAEIKSMYGRYIDFKRKFSKVINTTTNKGNAKAQPLDSFLGDLNHAGIFTQADARSNHPVDNIVEICEMLSEDWRFARYGRDGAEYYGTDIEMDAADITMAILESISTAPIEQSYIEKLVGKPFTKQSAEKISRDIAALKTTPDIKKYVDAKNEQLRVVRDENRKIRERMLAEQKARYDEALRAAKADTETLKAETKKQEKKIKDLERRVGKVNLGRSMDAVLKKYNLEKTEEGYQEAIKRMRQEVKEQQREATKDLQEAQDTIAELQERLENATENEQVQLLQDWLQAKDATEKRTAVAAVKTVLQNERKENRAAIREKNADLRTAYSIIEQMDKELQGKDNLEDLLKWMQAKDANTLRNTVRAMNATIADMKAEQQKQVRELKGELKTAYTAIREMERELQAATDADRAALLREWLAAEDLRDANRQMTENAMYYAQQRRIDRETFNQRLAERLAERTQAMRQMATRKEETQQRRVYRDRVQKQITRMVKMLESPDGDNYVPDNLRREVTAFLDSINMTGFHGGVARQEAWVNRLSNLVNMMERLDTVVDDETASGISMDFGSDDIAMIRDFIAQHIQDNTEAPKGLYTMSSDELHTLDNIIKVINHNIVQANRLRANERYKTVRELSAASIAEMEAMDAKHTSNFEALNVLDNLLNVQQLDSFSFFEELGGAANSVFRGLRDGLNTKTRYLSQAEAFMADITAGADIKEWSGQLAQRREFKLGNGNTLTLSAGQVMELYELSKREQATRHMYYTEEQHGEGIKIATSRYYKKGKRRTQEMDRAVRITQEDVQRITDTLTPQQRMVADAMQRFMATECSAWGNKASIQLQGFRKFTEADYYPIKTDSDTNKTSEMNPGDGSKQNTINAIRNMGMTKATNVHANNAIMVGDIFDTFSDHVDDMSTYAAFVNPMADAMKWINYKQRNEDTGYMDTVKRSINRVKGQGKGTRYVIQLLRDINGLTSDNGSFNLFDQLLSHTKAAAVGGNIRVVLQQPTAYTRALAMIDAQYLAKGALQKNDLATLQKYAPIAKWKSWGFYQLDTGKNMRQIIVGDNTVMQNITEKSMALAGLADDFTWGKLWNAVLAETQDKRKDLAVGSEEYYQYAARRFTDIVDRTQVVDSVFHRSQLMRSQNGIIKMETSFMAEPTKSYNLMRSALVRLLRNKKDMDARKNMLRTTATFLITAFGTSVAASIADAFRDPDKDKTWMDKYLSSVGKNFIENANPLEAIPFFKDLVSMFDGYDVQRMDMQNVSKLIKAVQGAADWVRGNSKWNGWKVAYNMAQALSGVTGLPVGNILRDAVSLVDTALPEGIRWTADTKTEKVAKLTAALEDGDKEKAAKIKEDLSKDTSAKTIQQKVVAELADTNEKVAAAADALNNTDTEAYNRLVRELQDSGFDLDTIKKAINKKRDIMKDAAAVTDAENPKTGTGEETKEYSMWHYEDLANAIYTASQTGDTKDVEAIVADITKYNNSGEVNKGSITKYIKPIYQQLVEADDDRAAADLAAILINDFDYKSDTIKKWVQE